MVEVTHAVKSSGILYIDYLLHYAQLYYSQLYIYISSQYLCIYCMFTVYYFHLTTVRFISAQDFIDVLFDNFLPHTVKLVFTLHLLSLYINIYFRAQGQYPSLWQ